MKMINSIAALALYALSVTLMATSGDATAGHDVSNVTVAALNEADLAQSLYRDAPMTESIIERAQTAFAAQLALDCVAGAQAEWVAEDAVYQYALSGIDVSLRMEGRSVIAAHLCALSNLAPDAIAQNIRYFPTLKPDLVYVQYDLVATDGTGKRSSPLAIIQMREDQIVTFTQLSRSPDSLKVLTGSL